MHDRFTSGHLWPDENGVHINAHGGGILFHEGVYYWYGEHKIEGPAGNAAHVGVHVYSSTDLYNWKDQGVALRVSDDPASDITHGCIIERPKVIYNRSTRKFVMWFHLEPKSAGYSGARSAVAIADAPTGPFTFVRSLRPNAGIWPINSSPNERHLLSGDQLEYLNSLKLNGGFRANFPRDLIFRRDFASGQMARDMTLFVDDDGAAYHVYASEDNSTLHISRLSDDYTAPAGQYVRVFPGRFHEAPTVLKRRGRYFLITSDCTGWSPNAARLSSADSIWGPWTEHGNPCIGPPEQIATTFDSQGTYILPISGREDAYIFIADRWRPQNAIDGRYVWLPIEFHDDLPRLRWHDEWDLSVFDGQRSST